MRREQCSRGFTLVELMIVVVILGVIAAIAVPQYLNYIEQSKIRSAEAVLDQFPVLLEQARADHGAMCPPGCGSCAALNTNTAIKNCFPDFKPALQSSATGAYEYYLRISTDSVGEVAKFGANTLIDTNFPPPAKISPGEYR